MNFDASCDSDKTKDVITIYWITTACKLIVQTFKISINNKYIIINLSIRIKRLIKNEFFGATGLIIASYDLFSLL